jgi:quinol monooxygenase YgiN
MVNMTIAMNAIPAKQQELMQALDELVSMIRQESGCLQCSLVHKNDDTKMLTVSEKWADREDMLNHVRSEYFRVLIGAIRVLVQSAEMTLNTESQTIRRDVKLSPSFQDIYSCVANQLFENSLHPYQHYAGS